MKKAIVLVLCLLILCSSQVAMAGENCLSYSFDIETCDELKLSYSKGDGEFWSPLAMGCYEYVTTDPEEIETILGVLSDMEFTPADEWGASGGEGFWIDIDGESVMHFLLWDGVECPCYVFGEPCFFQREEFREIEKLALDYKTKNDIKIYLDGEEIKFYNSPYITNGRTLVPAEFISEKLGIEADWGGDCVTLTKDDKTLTIYDDYVRENGVLLPIDVGYQMADGLAMIPIRKVAEFFGYEVKWENNSVYIIGDQETKTEIAEPNVSIEYFSYAEDRKMYAEDKSGVKTSGFVNTTETEITFENVAEHAKKECTVEYDTVTIYLDTAERIWKVHFGKELLCGGDQSVYMDYEGRTVLIVYGE